MSTDSPARKWGVCDADNDVTECNDEADAQRITASRFDLGEQAAIVYKDPGGSWIFKVSRAEVNPPPEFGTTGEAREFDVRRTALLAAAAVVGGCEEEYGEKVVTDLARKFEPYLRGEAK